MSQVTSAAEETSGLSPEFQMLTLPTERRRQIIGPIFGLGLLTPAIDALGFRRFQPMALRARKLRDDYGLVSIT